jgi:hypothetical protein
MYEKSIKMINEILPEVDKLLQIRVERLDGLLNGNEKGGLISDSTFTWQWKKRQPQRKKIQKNRR